MREQDIARLKVRVDFKAAYTTSVAIDPGELDAVILNVLDNALYWLSKVPDGSRELLIRIRKIKRGERVRVAIHDSGPGVPEEDAERVFWPGVTRKPGGIGMGLTVASEIVDAHDGRMGLMSYPGELGGASFEFDLPVQQSS